MDRSTETERQMDGLTDRHVEIDRWTDRQTDRWIL